MDWLGLLAVLGTLKSLLQHHSTKALILQCSAFFIVQLSHPYMTTGKTVAFTRWTFVGEVMSLIFNMLSRLVIIFLPRKIPMDVCNLTSGSSAFSKSSLNIWKFMVHVLLKPGLENFEHYFTSVCSQSTGVSALASFLPKKSQG